MLNPYKVLKFHCKKGRRKLRGKRKRKEGGRIEIRKEKKKEKEKKRKKGKKEEELRFEKRKEKKRKEKKKESEKEVYSLKPMVPPGILLSSMPSTTIGFERWAVTSAVSSLNSFSA